MPINTYFRGVAYVKDFMQHYLSHIFMAAEKGSILLTNGFKQIKFSGTPWVVKRGSWDYRNLPAVLIGAVSGNYKYMSIGKDIYRVTEPTETTQAIYYGGDMVLTVEMDVRATTQEERDNLVDIVCLFLAHPDAKDYFLRSEIVLETPPSIGGERELFEPSIDYPIYSTSVSMVLRTVWQIKTDMPYRISELLVDPEFVLSIDDTNGS